MPARLKGVVLRFATPDGECFATLELDARQWGAIKRAAWRRGRSAAEFIRDVVLATEPLPPTTDH